MRESDTLSSYTNTPPSDLLGIVLAQTESVTRPVVGPCTGMVLCDRFVDTYGTLLLHHTMDTGPGWSIALYASQGTTSDPFITTSPAGCTDTASASTPVCYSAAGQSNGTVTMLWTYGGTGGALPALVGRFQDIHNFYWVQYQNISNAFDIVRWVSGSATVLASDSLGGTFSAGGQYTLTFAFSGSNITAGITGPGISASLTATDSTFNSVQNFGFMMTNFPAANGYCGTFNQFTFA